MNLRERIQTDLTAAMRAQQPERLGVLRMMKAAVKNREIELRHDLDDGAVVQVLSTLIKQRRDSIEQFTRGGRADLAAKEAAEITVIEEYLPASASDAEIATVVDEVIRATGASSIRELGIVMKQSMARFAGRRVDGSRVSDAVHRRLS